MSRVSASAHDQTDREKRAVYEFWNEASCGEAIFLTDSASDYASQSNDRYRLLPFIHELAKFPDAAGKNVLEIGVGLGADHENFARAGARLCGVDLTERAIEHTAKRFTERGLQSDLRVADAEHLPFTDCSFDIVYSWGVLHHTPNTERAVREVWRVLSPRGRARIMIYHKYAMVGYMLWLRYAFFTFSWTMALSEIYARYLESPGTKAYSTAEARHLFRQFSAVDIRIQLTPGDLLTYNAGQRHRGLILSTARRLWPRRLIQRLLPGHGLCMMISAVK